MAEGSPVGSVSALSERPVSKTAFAKSGEIENETEPDSLFSMSEHEISPHEMSAKTAKIEMTLENNFFIIPSILNFK